MRPLHTTYLSLGSNQGNRLENLQKAIHLIENSVGHITSISSVYETKSWGFSSDDFYNICVELTTFFSAEKLLKNLQSIESKLGRIRTTDTNYLARIIDIDILFFDSQIINKEHLKIPHPLLYERNFVLVPLVEIAPDFSCPNQKKTTHQLLQVCIDKSLIIKTKESVKTPNHTLKKHAYIAIEGNIGSGKTTLAKMMAQNYQAELILERFDDNPFLPKFYKKPKRYAFPLEMSFLADRHQQLSNIFKQLKIQKSFTISDYYLLKSLIFAKVTLQKDELQLFESMFKLIYQNTVKPDLYIYLYQSTDKLLENIKKRGRAYENSIQGEYLEKIQQEYLDFIKNTKELNAKIIDITNFDFVENTEDFYKIIQVLA